MTEETNSMTNEELALAIRVCRDSYHTTVPGSARYAIEEHWKNLMDIQAIRARNNYNLQVEQPKYGPIPMVHTGTPVREN